MRPFVGTLLVIVLLAAAAACGPERNRAPTVELTASTTQVAVGEEVVVDGSGSSDPDGDPILFDWTIELPEGSALDLGRPRGDSIAFRPDVAGTYTVDLSVTDGEFSTPSERVSVEAVGEAVVPTADAGPDQSVAVGDEVTLDASASTHPQDAQLTYAWSVEARPDESTAELDDPTAQRPSFVADAAGDFIIGLVVSDGTRDSDMDTVAVTAAQPGDPPVADAGDDQTVSVDQEVVLDGSSSEDPDGGSLDFAWSFTATPDGSVPSIQDSTSATARFTPQEAGVYEVELEVRDPDDMADTDSVQITAESTLSPICMFISEYIEGTSNNKAVELYNCGGDDVDLSTVGFCVVSNDNTTCTQYDFILSGTLASGEVHTLCNTSLDDNVFDKAGCDEVSGSVNFNGDDRLVVYEDVDSSEDLSADDKVVDAFGEVASRPSGLPWSDKTLRRCDFSRLDGQSGFNYPDHYTEAAVDDFDDFGTAPTSGCD
jgi:hypothetical protein